MGIWIDMTDSVTSEKRADECLVRVGQGGSGPLVFPLTYADRISELIDALRTAFLCECVIHGCGSDDV